MGSCTEHGHTYECSICVKEEYIAMLSKGAADSSIVKVKLNRAIKSLQSKHDGLLQWAEGAKLDNEGLQSRITELESALKTMGIDPQRLPAEKNDTPRDSDW